MKAPLESVPGVCDVQLFRGARAKEDAPPDLLIEIPHGATRAHHFELLRAQLRGPFPDDLIAFFHVNTDAGAPEYGRALAERLVLFEPSRSVLVLASEIPRTFIDCNRVLDSSPEELKAGKVTPGLPPYVRDPADVRLLRARYDGWVRASEAAFSWCCGNGGLALMAHTYAPRSVDVEVDDQIVASLRRAYQPELEPTWPLRPEIDLIARDPQGNLLGEPLVSGLSAALTLAGFETAISGTYPLHPSTLAFHHAQRYQPRAACLEVRRDLLALEFVPFVEVQISPEKVARLVEPLARALQAAWAPGLAAGAVDR